MRSIYRQLVSGTLLALYGVISLLGHGLHWLSLEDHHHHHHHGTQVAHCEHDHSGHAHHHGGDHHHRDHHAPAPAKDAHRNRPLEVTATDCATLAHECEICAFLLQARGERPQIVTPIVWQHVIAAAPAAMQRSYSPVSLGPHAARGPPSTLA